MSVVLFAIGVLAEYGKAELEGEIGRQQTVTGGDVAMHEAVMSCVLQG